MPSWQLFLISMMLYVASRMIGPLLLNMTRPLARCYVLHRRLPSSLVLIGILIGFGLTNKAQADSEIEAAESLSSVLSLFSDPLLNCHNTDVLGRPSITGHKPKIPAIAVQEAERDMIRPPIPVRSPLGRPTHPGESLASTEEALYVKQFAGCEALLGQVRSSQRAQLTKCAESLKRHYQKKTLSESKRAISRLKSNRLKRFIAMTRTAYGEADPRWGPTDMMAIMKVVDNRTRACRQKRQADCNNWDVAVMPMQFSMYNDTIHSRNPALFVSASGKQMQKAISSFIDYQTASFDSSWDKVHYYHANYVSPSWGRSLRKVSYGNLKINGQQVKSTGTRHIFYQDPNDWSFVRVADIGKYR